MFHLHLITFDYHSMETEINILYPFLLAHALYIMNYSTRAQPVVGNRDVRVVGTAVIARVFLR